MKTYWITFRLAAGTHGGRDYDARYDALVKAVHAHCGSHWWHEPTSFWLLNSESTRTNIAASIKKAINPTVDLAVIGTVDYKGITLVGTADKLADLKTLVPEINQA